jgi:hypothetical protein
MKTAVKVLVIIAGVIGIIWPIVGFFGTAIGGSLAAVFAETEEAEREFFFGSISIMMKLLGSSIVVVAGLVFGIIAAGKEIRRVPGIVLSVLLIVSGVLATALASFVTGPMYVLAGILAVIANAVGRGRSAAT